MGARSHLEISRPVVGFLTILLVIVIAGTFGANLLAAASSTPAGRAAANDEMHALRAVPPINISVKNGRVTLTGIVSVFSVTNSLNIEHKSAFSARTAVPYGHTSLRSSAVMCCVSALLHVMQFGFKIIETRSVS